jgi:hypothetical protein
MRFALLLAIVAVLCSCSTKQAAHSTATANPAAVQTDAIGTLVSRLSSSHGMWRNGISSPLGLPASAPTEQVVARAFRMNGFDKGHVKTYHILEIRQVAISETLPNPDVYKAVLVDADLGKKIVILKYESWGWWSRAYDAE